MSPWEFVGFMASLLSASTFLPEVVTAIKTRHLKDIAWGMLILLNSNCVLWIAYSLYFSIAPVFLSAVLNLVMGSILIAIKWRSEHTSILVAIPISEEILNNK